MIFNPVYGGASAPNLGTKNITANDTYLASADGLDGFSEVTVAVPNSYSASDEGKVVDGGVLVTQTSTTKTANGTYDTTLNNEVVVNVSSDPKIYTGEDEDYVFETAGELICTLSNRAYTKTTADKAYVAYFTSTGNYTQPILVSKIADGVKYTALNNTFSYQGTFTYGGETYYYSKTEYAMGGNITSTAGRGLKLTGTYASAQAAGEALLDLALGGGAVKFTANGSYPVPAGYDGYGDIEVNVSPTLQAKTGISITENGSFSFTPDNGYDGLSVVSGTVSVSGGGGTDDPFALTDYIESSGTQYVDTGYAPTQTSRYEIVANVSTTNSAWATLFGARSSRNTDYGNAVWLGAKTNNANSLTYNWGFRNATLSQSHYFGVKTVFQLQNNSVCLQPEGYLPTGAPFTAGATLTSATLYLFSLNVSAGDYGAETRGSMKLYRFRIYEGDTLVHEFIPWVDGNNVVCLKDTITNTLKYNLGTGSFTYGADA